MKKFLALFFTFLMCFSSASVNIWAANMDISVTVHGERVYFDQQPVIVDEHILVPIRAVCEKIGATVTWDSDTRTILISKGNERLILKIDSQTMLLADGSTVYLATPPTIYNGRTLLPIRAVVENLGYEVQWDESIKTVKIEEAGVILVPNLNNTQVYGIRNFTTVSSIQQFSYKNEGLAYAYARGNNLEIATPSTQFSLEMKYPKLGDVIADKEGNFYIIWGKDNNTQNTSIETIFISKYSPKGQHINTTGFVGQSSPWGNDNSAKTKIPFDAGNCASAISDDGILVSYYAKERYDGHQSDNVIAVNTSNMNAYEFKNNTFSGHSFNQSIIYSKVTSDFLFASHGDAYARGFIVTDSNGKYGDEKEVVFHFYLPPNANYNMHIVNKTFAQLGGLVETSKGVALVGASAKSISQVANEESQNLFVQIFDPTKTTNSSSKYIGGQERTGATATNIRDNSNAPLTSVTDYGVHWLTNYTDKNINVTAPQVVSADNHIVILWSTNDDSFYTVLEADGKVLVPATSLNGLPLNSFEAPIYHDGTIYWVASKNERLKVYSLEIKNLL